jgi:hypothetical protein
MDQYGNALTGSGYSVEENIQPNVGITSNYQFVAMNNGVATDHLGWSNGYSPADNDIVTTQTFVVAYQGAFYVLSTTFQHENLSVQGIVSNYVSVITP